MLLSSIELPLFLDVLNFGWLIINLAATESLKNHLLGKANNSANCTEYLVLDAHAVWEWPLIPPSHSVTMLGPHAGQLNSTDGIFVESDR